MNNSSIITTSAAQEVIQLLSVKNILLTPVLALVILITIFGNLLVVSSVIVERSLRTPSNSLIFSLAISDLMAGLIVMPLRGTVAIFGRWPFEFRCDLPLEINVIASMASVLHLVAIAIDRYIIVSKIHNTNMWLQNDSKARITVMLILVWTIPALYAFAPFMGWHDSEWRSRNSEYKCVGNKMLSYRLVGLVITFYIPIPIIIIFYFLIYKIAKQSSRHKRKHNIQHSRLDGRHSAVEWESDCPAQPVNQTVCGQVCSNNIAILKRKYSNIEEREKKVAKTLVIITTVFLLFWSPFFIFASIYINEEPLPYLLYETVIWFGLTNSAVNPIIYAYFVPTFRLAFRKILFRK